MPYGSRRDGSRDSQVPLSTPRSMSLIRHFHGSGPTCGVRQRQGTLREGLRWWQGSGITTSLLFGTFQSFAKLGAATLTVCFWVIQAHGKCFLNHDWQDPTQQVKSGIGYYHNDQMSWHRKWTKEEMQRFCAVYVCVLDYWDELCGLPHPTLSQGCTKHILTHCSPLLSKYAITFGRKFDRENLKP